MLLRFFPHGASFIKAYTTNILTAPRNAFIDTRGRIVAVFDQYQVSEDEVWAVVEKRCVDRLRTHLSKFLHITDVKMEMDEKIRIYWDLDNKSKSAPEGDIFIPQRAGTLWLTSSARVPNVSSIDMTLFRIKNNIPWQGIDFDDELLLCVGDEEYVSYLKGCYLGQEIITRVQTRGRPPKKLNVKLLRDCSVEQKKSITSRVIDPTAGEPIGFVFDKTAEEV
jgi:folate-binding protein YgfZ